MRKEKPLKQVGGTKYYLFCRLEDIRAQPSLPVWLNLPSFIYKVLILKCLCVSETNAFPVAIVLFCIFVLEYADNLANRFLVNSFVAE